MCVALAISLFAGCAHFESIEYSQEISEENPQTVEAFDQFINDIFETEVTENTINLHFTISDPEKYGITDYPVTLGDLSIDAMADSNARLENYLSGLNSFSYTELTLNQQLTYICMMNCCAHRPEFRHSFRSYTKNTLSPAKKTWKIIWNFLP